MKYFDLDKEEQELFEDIERGKFKRVKEVEKAKKEAVVAAKNTLQKSKNLNIRISQKDLLKLKSKSVNEGIPYQTLAFSFLHRAVSE